jgi:hypothetical protein
MCEMSAETHLGLHVKYPLLLSGFNENRNVLTDFSKNAPNQISGKSV